MAPLVDAQHENIVASMHNRTIAESMILVENTVAMYPYLAFLTHFKNMGLQDKEAKALWHESVANPDIERETEPDGSVALAVRLPKIYKSWTSIAEQRELVGTVELPGNMDVHRKQVYDLPPSLDKLNEARNILAVRAGRHVTMPKKDSSETTGPMGSPRGKDEEGVSQGSQGPVPERSVKRRKVFEEAVSTAMNADVDDAQRQRVNLVNITTLALELT